MSGSDQSASARGADRRPSRRRWVAPVLIAAVVVPYAITLADVWTSTGTDTTFAQRERDGIVMMRPLVALIAATGDAQTSAVAGHPPAAASLQAAVKAVDAADQQVGSTLASSGRWGDLRTDLSRQLAAGATGPAAYTAFSRLVDLESALVTAVADSSNLILDPQLDSYYLMDTTVLQVPSVLVDGGRTVDLAVLAEQHQAGGLNDGVAAAIAGNEVQESSARIDAGLRKAFAATTSTSLGPGMLAQLDQMRSAVTALAPPTAAVGAVAAARSSAAIQVTRIQMRDAVLGVDAAGLDQLDLLISHRLDGLSATRRLVALSTLAGLLIVLATAWVVGPRRRRDRLDDVAADENPAEGPDGEDPHRGDPDAHGDHGDRGDRSDHGGAVREGEDPDLMEAADLLRARDLLPARHLVRVGRAVSSTREKR